MTDQVLHSIYYDARHEASFSGAAKLLTAARKISRDITKQQVVEWLRKQTTYTLHKQARKRFRRNPFISTAIGEHCQADLVDLSMFKRENDGYSFLLTFIDIFSKKATAVPLKTKEMKEVASAFKTVFRDFVCSNILTDRGTEFRNTAVSQLMKRVGVLLKVTYNDEIKASVVERFNRSLKSKMFKFFTANATRRYVTVLHQIVSSYNKSYHRSIRMAPNDVTADNSGIVFRNLYGYDSVRDMMVNGVPERAKFGEGDTVRRRYVLGPFDKGYLPTYSDQIYTVSNVVKGSPRTMYKLTDWQGKELDRKYYSEDLQLVSDVSFRVEKVIRRRKGHALVRWLNHPSSADSWVPLSAIKHVSRR